MVSIYDVAARQIIIKFATKAKFEDKVLIRKAMRSKNSSHLFIIKTMFAIKEQRQLNKFIPRYLIPYIGKNYKW